MVLEQLNLKASKGDAGIYWIASYSLCTSTWNVSSLLYCILWTSYLSHSASRNNKAFPWPQWKCLLQAFEGPAVFHFLNVLSVQACLVAT